MDDQREALGAEEIESRFGWAAHRYLFARALAAGPDEWAEVNGSGR